MKASEKVTICSIVTTATIIFKRFVCCSQSTDSEPVYDRPHAGQYQSDSEASSASPVIFENTTPNYSYTTEGSPNPCPYDADGSSELYSEIPTPAYEAGFLRSHEGHTKRNLYTGIYF